MKSKLVILSLLLAGATAATAQTKETFYSESFKDNIFVSVGVGAQGCVNPDNFDYGFGKAITPLILPNGDGETSPLASMLISKYLFLVALR